MRGVHVVEAATVGAEVLDGFLAGHRSAGEGLLGAGERVDHLVVVVEVLDGAADDQDDRGDHADRQQDAQRAAHQVDPEVAEVTGVLAGKSAHHRDRDGHAHRGRHEVLHGEAGHLHQMAHGGLTGVGLPVGVRDEADRGVPRQCRRHRGGRVVEVQRQLARHQQEDEQEQDADRREGQHAARVGAPGLLRAGVGADQPVDDPFDAIVLLRRSRPGTCSRPAARGRPRARRSGGRGRRSPPMSYSLEPLREQQCRRDEQGQQHGQDQADDVLVAHSRSTSFCTRPSRAKIATVSRMNMTTPMSLRSRQIDEVLAVMARAGLPGPRHRGP